MCRLRAQHRLGRNFLRWPLDAKLIGAHTAGGNGRLRLGAALEQAALDEKPIDANAGSHMSSAHETSGAQRSKVARTRTGTNNDAWLLFPSRRAGASPARISRELNHGTTIFARRFEGRGARNAQAQTRDP